MKRFAMIFLGLAIFIGYPSWIEAQPHIVPEPSLNQSLGWGINAAGMLMNSYDLDHNGKADFYTLRIVLRHYPSTQTIQTVTRSNPGLPVYYINAGSYHQYYIASAQPMMYALDFNENGVWDLMVKDPLEDGVNGNEQFYDSPSGLFAPNFQMVN